MKQRLGKLKLSWQGNILNYLLDLSYVLYIRLTILHV